MGDHQQCRICFGSMDSSVACVTTKGRWYWRANYSRRDRDCVVLLLHSMYSSKVHEEVFLLEASIIVSPQMHGMY